jgi:hypothetical protein
MPKPTKLLAIRCSPAQHEALRRHAFERNVTLSTLARDVLTMWVRAVTSPDDPLFHGQFGRIPDPPDDIYPGYLEGLGFGDV